jgi:hypothetical protein
VGAGLQRWTWTGSSGANARRWRPGDAGHDALVGAGTALGEEGRCNRGSDLTMIIDLRSGPDGNLYALQMGQFIEQGPTPNSGAMYQFLPHDVPAVLRLRVILLFDAESVLVISPELTTN